MVRIEYSVFGEEDSLLLPARRMAAARDLLGVRRPRGAGRLRSHAPRSWPQRAITRLANFWVALPGVAARALGSREVEEPG